jgi:hypothetical protein
VTKEQRQTICEPHTYEIRLLSKNGGTKLTYETICCNDDEAIDKLFAITHFPYSRFEITCAGDMISRGGSVNAAK